MPKNSFFIDSCILLGTVIKDENIKPKIKYEILHAIVDMLISTKLGNFVPSNNDMKVYSEIRDSDDRISESDIIHATCAKILGIPLVTTDGMMQNSRGLKEHVDIMSPVDVL